MYFAFVIDVFSRMIVGWQLASHMRTDLVLDALRMALGTRQPGADVAAGGTHRQRARNTSAEDYTQVLADHLVLASVGSVGDCYDNALSESFVDSLQDRADRRPRVAHQRAARARDRRLRRLVQPPPAALLDREPTARRTRTRVLGAPRARARTVPGSGRPNSHRSTRRSDRGLSDLRVEVLTLTDTINYSTTNDSPSNPGKSSGPSGASAAALPGVGCCAHRRARVARVGVGLR